MIFTFIYHLQILNLSAWTLSIAAMLLVVFGNYPFYQFHYGLLMHWVAFFGRSLRATSFLLAIISSINWFLSHRWWLPLSRLSYPLCLIHYPIFQITMFSMKIAPDFNELSTNYHFIPIYIIYIVVAIVATLAFESPIISSTNMIFSNSKDSGSNITLHKTNSKKKKWKPLINTWTKPNPAILWFVLNVCLIRMV